MADLLAMEKAIAALQREVSALRKELGNSPVRGAAGGGGGMAIAIVDLLPALPTKPRFVFHSVDGQVWGSGPGCTRWYPVLKCTSLNGAPGD